MFTGIIKHTGLVQNKTTESITIQCPTIIKKIKKGSSVAVDGICLTIREKKQTQFTADVMPVTFEKTNLGNRKKGEKVNLELAMQFDERFEGHILTGHIEDSAPLIEMQKQKNAVLLTFEIHPKLQPFVVNEGSIALNGISLTIAKTHKNLITVSIIPHTWEETNLHKLKKGTRVNVEIDILAKYVQKLISHGKH